MPAASPWQERIWKYVSPEPNTGCWLWDGSWNIGGYGHMRGPRGAMAVSHRLMWVLLRGEIPEGLVIDHKCRVRACCNPDHLEVVTERVNILRGEGACAKWARRTHCPEGHEFSPLNTRRNRGARICLICERAWHAVYRAKLRAAKQ